MSQRPPAVWPPFVRASLALALTAGFGLGGALFAASALGIPSERWWAAAAQAHGHIQLFGWAGLLVFGVGFHFLPRLRGAPLAWPTGARIVLGLLLVGLIARALAQPILAGIGAGPLASAFRAGLVGSGVLELTGATLALGMLGRTLRGGPPIRAGSGLRQVLPFLGAAFAACWLALALNLVGLLAATRGGVPLVAARLDHWTTAIALHGFLVPIGIAMSARLFPLYLRTPPARPRLLWLGLAGLLGGLALRIAGEAGDLVALGGIGQLAQAAALGLLTLTLGIFARPVPLPRPPVQAPRDPVAWHARTAYVWLSVAALVLAWGGVADLGADIVAPPRDAEIHALGVGFVTILILGVGARLLPGFARQPLRSPRLVWLTLALGNAAALLRVGPLLATDHIPATAMSAALILAGPLGLLAIAVFCANPRGI